MTLLDEMDAALAQAWGALMWAKNYDSKDGTLARAISEIERVRKVAGTYDYDSLRAKVEASRLLITADLLNGD